MTHDKRARIKMCTKLGVRTGEQHATAIARESVMIRGLTAVPGVARRLAHRRRCQPGGGGGSGDGGGGCDGGR